MHISPWYLISLQRGAREAFHVKKLESFINWNSVPEMYKNYCCPQPGIFLALFDLTAILRLSDPSHRRGIDG